MLLGNGADISARDDKGQLPIHCAAYSGHIWAAEALLNAGGHLNQRDAVIAAELVARSALEDRSGRNLAALLCVAILLKLDVAIGPLLGNGADVDATDVLDAMGSTPLHFAAKTGHAEAVSSLLNYRADVHARTEEDETPLHHAAYEGNESVALLLLQHGAEIDSKNDVGETALQCAVLEDHVGMARLLLANGAGVNAPDESDTTALHTAVSQENLAMMRLLLESGADINAVNDDGKTPLEIAVEKNHADAVKILNHTESKNV